MSQQIVGYDADGNLWGWWCGGGICNFNTGSQFWTESFHHSFVPHSPVEKYFGSFRIPTTKAFNSYVGDRWYDPVFWAPKDTYPMKSIISEAKLLESFISVQTTVLTVQKPAQ